MRLSEYKGLNDPPTLSPTDFCPNIKWASTSYAIKQTLSQGTEPSDSTPWLFLGLHPPPNFPSMLWSGYEGLHDPP
jgi:hypothetical protein